jgi:hypothetical protein
MSTINFEIEEAGEVEIELAPPVFAVYEKETYIKKGNWNLKLPLFTIEEDANKRRDDLLEISHAHGLLTDYEVRELEVENNYEDARYSLYHSVDQEALGINR